MCLILIGCTGIPFIQKRETITLPSIYEGVRGITMSYLDQLPPQEIHEKQLFEIGIELHNQGATDIQNGMYNIAVNEQFVTLLDEKMNRFNIKGKSMYEPLGAKKRIILKARANELRGQLSGQGTTIITNICYEYFTRGTIMTCIDTEPLKKQAKVCQVETETERGGQGGPVAVVSLEPKMLPHEDPNKIIPSYIIEIDNVGTGQVIDIDSVYSACTGQSIGKENYDTVVVNAMLSDQLLECTPYRLKLRQKENKILCKLSQGLSKTMGNYQTPLTLELEYGYMQTQPKTITIRKYTY